MTMSHSARARTTALRTAGVMVLLSVAACGRDTTAPLLPQVDRPVATPSADAPPSLLQPTVSVMSLGDSKPLAALVQSVIELSEASRVTVDDPAVAEVDASGMVRTHGYGTTRVDVVNEGTRWSTLLTVAPAVEPARGASPLLSRSGSPSAVASLSISTGTSLMEVTQSVRFQAIARDSRGNVLTGAGIRWVSSAPSVIGITADGQATSVAPGEALLIAQSGSVARSVRVSSELIRIRTVRVTPSTVTLTVGESVQLVATPLNLQGQPISMADGGRCTFSSSLQTVMRSNLDGLLFAIAAGTATITASCGDKTTSTPATVLELPAGTPPPGGPPTPPPGGNPPPPGTPPTPPAPPPNSPNVGQPDLAALAIVGGQLKDLSRYSALSVPSQASGWSYADPSTGVRVWKVTSASVPAANGSAWHEYSEGPVQISYPWGDGNYTLLLEVAREGYWFVDFRRGQGLSSWRRVPAGSMQITFSRNPSTPRIAYVATMDGRLRRFDTGSMSFADSGPFPATFPVSGAGRWLQNSYGDSVFVAIGSGERVITWDVRTNRLRSRNYPNLDEPYLERDGRFVMVRLVSTGPAPMWDLAADTTWTAVPPSVSGFVHMPTLRGLWPLSDIAAGGGRLPQWTYEPALGGFVQGGALAGYQSAYHGSGQWYQPASMLPGGSLRKQWWVRSTYDWSAPWPVDGGLAEGVAFVRADGTESRLLLHHYSVLPSRGADQYFSTPRALVSPDGALVMFTSNMNNSPRTDVFLAEVPLR